MNLDDAQRKKVAEWIAQGCKLSEIQDRLRSELGLKLTYMEARLLVDDLKLVPKDAEHAAPAVLGAPGKPGKTPEKPVAPPPPEEPEEPEAPAGGVSVSVDQLARPGAVASGKVQFSDGKVGQWYFDQTGRLGMVPPEPGYRPSQADLQEFQMALEAELGRMGF